jgi:hypothetical protein
MVIGYIPTLNSYLTYLTLNSSQKNTQFQKKNQPKRSSGSITIIHGIIVISYHSVRPELGI